MWRRFLTSSGNGGVTLDESGHDTVDTSSSLDTEGKRSDIEEKKILSLLRGITGRDGGLDGSTIA